MGKKGTKEAPPKPPVAPKAHGYEFGGPYVPLDPDLLPSQC